MKKTFSILLVITATLSFVMLTSCKKEETVGEKLDKSIENTDSGLKKLTKKASDAADSANKEIEKAINNK